MINLIPNLYNAVSALVAATRDTLPEGLQSKRETAFILYKRMMDDECYWVWAIDRLKDILEKGAREDEEGTEDTKKNKQRATLI